MATAEPISYDALMAALRAAGATEESPTTSPGAKPAAVPSARPAGKMSNDELFQLLLEHGLQAQGRAGWEDPGAASTRAIMGVDPSVDQTPPAPPPPYTQSSVPWLDPINAAAAGAIKGVPIVGNSLYNALLPLDAAWASMIEGKQVTPEERDQISQGERGEFPTANALGGLAGTVAPLMMAGATPVGAALMGNTGGLFTRMGTGAASSFAIFFADALAEGKTPQQAAQSALLAMGIGGAGPLVGATANKLLLGGTPQDVATLARTAIDKFGIPVNASQLSPNALVRGADAVVNKMPFSGGTVAGPAQQTAFNRAVSKIIGEDADKITPAVISSANARVDKAFTEAAARTPAISADHEFLTSISKLAADARSNLAESQVTPLFQQVRDVLETFQRSGGKISGPTYLAITKPGEALDRLASGDSAVSTFAIQLRDAIDGAFIRSATTLDDVRLLQAARDQRQALNAVQDAVSGLGVVEPAAFEAAVRRYYPEFATGGGGDIGELARIGSQFVRAPSKGGAINSLMNFGPKVGGAAGLGALALNPAAIPMALALGLPTAAITAAAGRLAGAGMRSPKLVNKLIDNSIGPRAVPTLANAGPQGLNRLVRP